MERERERVRRFNSAMYIPRHLKLGMHVKQVHVIEEAVPE